MTDLEKQKVRLWRSEGLGYGAIANRLGLSENTVKSYCRRNGLTGVAAKKPVVICRYCGGALPPYSTGRKRHFCSDTCRRAWWKEHPDMGQRTAYYSMTCKQCGREFLSYGNKNRKYCSHTCYTAERFGKRDDHDKEAI